MTIRQKLNAIATENSSPCVTISLNTHRTHPDNVQDLILLKNLLKEAEERIIKEYGNGKSYHCWISYPVLKMKLT